MNNPPLFESDYGDFFAAFALAGAIAADAHNTPQLHPLAAANNAYVYADAMLGQRDATKD